MPRPRSIVTNPHPAAIQAQRLIDRQTTFKLPSCHLGTDGTSPNKPVEPFVCHATIKKYCNALARPRQRSVRSQESSDLPLFVGARSARADVRYSCGLGGVVRRSVALIAAGSDLAVRTPAAKGRLWWFLFLFDGEWAGRLGSSEVGTSCWTTGKYLVKKIQGTEKGYKSSSCGFTHIGGSTTYPTQLRID